MKRKKDKPIPQLVKVGDFIFPIGRDYAARVNAVDDEKIITDHGDFKWSEQCVTWCATAVVRDICSLSPYVMRGVRNEQ